MIDSYPIFQISIESCDGCDGSGVRWPAEPNCTIPELENSDWNIVERCDTCSRYPDNLSAAGVIYSVVKWVPCLAGGWHAVGKQHRR